MSMVYQFIDFEPSIYRHRSYVEFRILETSVSKETFARFLKGISLALNMQAHPEQPDPIITSATGHSLSKHNGLEGMLFWLESGMHAYYWELPQLITVDMHSCAFLDSQKVRSVAESFFTVINYSFADILPQNAKADSSKIEVLPNDKFGKGVYAKEVIKKDEFVAGFYGDIFVVQDAMAVPEHAVNHAIQFSPSKWRNSLGVANLLNHSCSPNCGISGLFDLVAMRDIQIGEELVWDYAMTENSNWIVPGSKCHCNSKNCRNVIEPYRNLPLEVKNLYLPYTSAWILEHHKVRT